MKAIIYIFILPFLSSSLLFAQTWKGSGTEADPYQITNIREFQDINKVRTKDKYFILMNDIEASETRNWNIGDHDKDSTTPDEPMGFVPIDLYYTFINGNGFIIRNLYLNFPKDDGIALFFTIVFSTIKRLGIVNCEITGKGFVSSMASQTDASIIEECYSTGNILCTDTNSSSNSAAFCAFAQSTTIENCYTECSISNPFNKHNYSVSAFYFTWTDLPSARYCYATGKATSYGKPCVFSKLEQSQYCFWDTVTTGIPDDGDNNSKGLSTSEMMKRSTYIVWDFDKIWYIDEGKDYPRLRAFRRDTTNVVEIENFNNNNFSISPNPATDFIEISIPASNHTLKGAVEGVRIYNVFGEEVYPIKSKEYLTPALSVSERELRIDVSGLAPGVYFMRIGEKVGKFVKM